MDIQQIVENFDYGSSDSESSESGDIFQKIRAYKEETDDSDSSKDLADKSEIFWLKYVEFLLRMQYTLPVPDIKSIDVQQKENIKYDEKFLLSMMS